MKRFWKVIFGGLLVTVLTMHVPQVSFADEGPTGARSSTANSSDSYPSRSAAGGAAMADFATLMNLIESTVDPDSWLSGGGTSVMLPFPAGIWVDPRGKLARHPVALVNHQRLEEQFASRGVPASSEQNPWHSASPLRMVSLRDLDQLLWNVSKKRAVVSPEVIRLAGLNRVQYVLINPEQEDIVLAGPADGNQNGFFLEDLAIVTGLICLGTKSFGCSIEPIHENLVRTQEYIASARSEKLLAQSPDKFAKQLEQLVGNQEAQIFGMPARSSTAVALLAADISMKELGFGRSNLPLKLQNYFDFLERESAIPKQSIVRWWFDYSTLPVACNPGNTLFRLPDNSVSLFSEQQFVSRTGRQPSGKSDPAANAFALEFNEHFDELRALEPNFSRMCCVFETALALQLSLEGIGMADFHAWFPTLSGLGRMEQEFVLQPQWVSCLVASHRMRSSRTNIAIVSGGVRINPKATATRSQWQVSSHLSGSQVPMMRDTTEPSHWWWD